MKSYFDVGSYIPAGHKGRGADRAFSLCSRVRDSEFLWGSGGVSCQQIFREGPDPDLDPDDVLDLEYQNNSCDPTHFQDSAFLAGLPKSQIQSKTLLSKISSSHKHLIYSNQKCYNYCNCRNQNSKKVNSKTHIHYFTPKSFFTFSISSVTKQ